MKLPGIITVDPADEELAIKLAHMGGDAFLEELWTVELLNALPAGSRGTDRERTISRAIIMNDIIVGAPYQAVYCLEDASALAIGYFKSDLEGLTWSYLEEKAERNLIDTVLSEEEAVAYAAQLERMAPISVFDWEERAGEGATSSTSPCWRSIRASVARAASASSSRRSSTTRTSMGSPATWRPTPTRCSPSTSTWGSRCTASSRALTSPSPRGPWCESRASSGLRERGGAGKRKGASAAGARAAAEGSRGPRAQRRGG